MRQFDICQLRKPRGRSAYVVVMQHDELGDLRTVLVAPPRIDSAVEHRPRLRPRVHFDGRIFHLAVDLLAVIDRDQLGETVGSEQSSADTIKRATDLAFFGN